MKIVDVIAGLLAIAVVTVCLAVALVATAPVAVVLLARELVRPTKGTR